MGTYALASHARDAATPRASRTAVDRAPSDVNPAWAGIALGIQPKLTVSTPGDPWEQEADAVADRVMRVPDPEILGASPRSIQRSCGCGGGSRCSCHGDLAPDIDTPTALVDVQRKCRECQIEDDRQPHVQTAPTGTRGPALDTDAAVRATRGAGAPLNEETLAYFEARFGLDFADVRVHTGTESVAGARAVQARAFALGSDIVFDAGEYSPDTLDGRRLLAHELVHVVQQGRAAATDESSRSTFTQPRLARHDAHGAPRPVIRRAPAPKAPAKPRDDELAIARADAFKYVDAWEAAINRAIGRYRNWLTHNLILFLGDALTSDKGAAAIDEIKGGFARDVVEQAIGNIGAMGVVYAGARFGGQQLAKLFLAARTARVLGGFIGFVLGAIVEAVIGVILDKTNEIVRTAAQQADKLVTNVVNPIVDAKQEAMTRDIQVLRNGLRDTDMPSGDWRRIAAQLVVAIDAVNTVLPKVDDEYLYRQLALRADVFSKTSVPAEQTPPVDVATESSFRFTMQHRVVKTGHTSIVVGQDRGIVVVRSRGYDCVVDEEGTGAIDIHGPDAPPSVRLFPPPRQYYLQLYQSSLFDKEIGIPRVFTVGREEFGIWYNLKRGAYHLLAWRADDHPIALCVEGKYSISSPAKRTQ